MPFLAILSRLTAVVPLPEDGDLESHATQGKEPIEPAAEAVAVNVGGVPVSKKTRLGVLLPWWAEETTLLIANGRGGAAHNSSKVDVEEEGVNVVDGVGPNPGRAGTVTV